MTFRLSSNINACPPYSMITNVVWNIMRSQYLPLIMYTFLEK